MNPKLVGLAIVCGFGALAWALAQALIEDGIRAVVRRRFPRFSAWWDSTGGITFRFTVLLAFFGITAVVFALPALGVALSGRPEPVLWVIVVPTAVMAVWTLRELRLLRKTSYHERYGGRSSDGTWSAD